ncbi:MAG: mechanosensitive ion channel [Alphaproteobacteria bacterium]|nr:mechanosensitive ion channel [Alphaproteobacteria bacterium]
MIFRDMDILQTIGFSAPRWLVVMMVMAAAVLAALVAHKISSAFLRSVLEPRFPVLGPIVGKTHRVRLFAILILALSLFRPLAPLSPVATDIFARFFLASFILLIGWIAIVAINIGFEFYSRQFQLDSADNLAARKAVTQIRVLRRAIDIFVLLIAAGFALMSFDSVRQFGVSLFASAGVAGIAAGLAARPLLGNLVAGMQIAITQPIRLGDVLVINGNWGTVEEITSTYVVMKIWDLRRYIIPLSFFFDTPFENWTRTSANLLGTVMIYADYRVPVGRVREHLKDVVKQTPLWDGKAVVLQVTDATKDVIELRALVSARSSGEAFELRCFVREKLIDYLGANCPAALPRLRGEFAGFAAANDDRSHAPG